MRIREAHAALVCDEVTYLFKETKLDAKTARASLHNATPSYLKSPATIEIARPPMSILRNPSMPFYRVGAS